MLFYLLVVVYVFLTNRNISYYVTSLSQYFIHFFVWFVASVIPTGYLLSQFSSINKPFAWGFVLIGFALLQAIIIQKWPKKSSFSLRKAIPTAFSTLREVFLEGSFFQKLTFGILFLGFLSTTLLNTYILFVSYPNEWDSMTGHLVKCAYYLQNGNMNRLKGTTWTVDFYPNSLPTLQLFFYHIAGEKGFKLIHYLSYWIFVLTTYKTTFLLFKNTRSALFVGLIAALLPTALIQTTMTETDLVFSAYLGCLVYLLFSFAASPSRWNAFLVILILGIWMSHKVTFILVLPPIFLLVVFVISQTKSFFTLKNSGFIALGIVLSIAIYVVPNGYIANLKEVGELKIGSLSAPKKVMAWHGIENYNTHDKLANLKLNILRYSSDFIHFDGLRSSSWGNTIDKSFRKPIDKFYARFGLERDSFWAVYPFRFVQNGIVFYKERPYWSFIGMGLVIPAIIVLIISVLKKRKELAYQQKMGLLFLICGTIHFLSLCYSAPYDPIKARYFMNMAIWFFPIIAFLFQTKSKVYSSVISILIVISAISTLLFRDLVPLTGKNTIANLSRVEQLLLARPDLTSVYQKYEKLVPADAVVALGTQQEHEDFEYPLWGAKFERKLIPLHPFRSNVKPIPAEAEYLFYSEGVFPHQTGDIQLNTLPENADSSVVTESTFYLRKLKN